MLKSTSFCELDREQAADAGFAVFNGGRHVCLELANEPTTISVKTPDGKLVTFAFTRRPEGDGHQCVDIVQHGKARNANGNPLQQASFLGQGPTNAVTKLTDESPTTIVVLSLPADN